MPKLYSGKEIVKRLRRLGFDKVSQEGSHMKLRGQVGGLLRTVIVPMHSEVAQGTTKSILLQAGISKSDLDSAK